MATINGTSGNDSLTGTSGNDTISGFGGNDVLLGAAGNDSLRGNDGTDWLEGGAGSDNLGGGGGQDRFVFREAGSANADVLSDYSSNWDNIQLDAAFFTSLGASGRFASGDARFVANSTGTAQDASDRIVLNTATGQLFYDADGNGSGAAQHFATLPSGRTVIASDFWVFGTAPSSGQTINGTSGNDSLVGGPGNDTINGLAGDDTIDGAAGADSMVGGAHADTYFVDNPGDVIVEFENGGFDTVNASVSYTLAAWVNHLTLTGSADIRGDGNELPNVIEGNAGQNFIFGFAGDDHLDGGDGHDHLDGGEGSDTMLGGAGRDGFRLAAEGGRDSINGGSDIDSVSMDVNLTQVIVDLQARTISAAGVVIADVLAVESVFATNFADQLTGDGFANDLLGLEGSDTLDGRGGNDTLNGGGGEDLYRFSVAPSATNADLVFGFASGFDTIQLDGTVHANSGPSGTFAAGDARFWSSSSGTAHDADDRVIYNTSSGWLVYDADGTGSGAAQLIATFWTGSGGTPSSLAATDIAIINGSSGGGGTVNGTPGNDSLVGGPGNDTINGLAGNDTLFGLGGDDSLIGGAGSDSMDGGLGNDTYVTDGSDSVTDAGGIDTMIVEGSFGVLPSGSGIENLTIRGYDPHPEAAYATGNELDNVIRDEGPGTSSINGEGGNDTLIGSDGGQDFSFWGNLTPGGGINDEYGHDFVDGGGGNDVLFFDSNSVAVTVDFRNGTVTGGSRVAASVTFTNIEGALGTGLGDVMFANDAGNELWGWAGDDTVTGGAGADTITGDSFVDPADSFGNDRLLGGGGNDDISGEEGDDWIDGGAGSDNLTGDNPDGGWADSFAFTVAPGASNADTIFNFVSAEDRIVLDGAVHASSGPSGRFTASDGRFAANSSGTAQDSSDRVVYNTGTGELWYDADGNGAGGRQLIATLVGAPTLGASNMEVINGSSGGGGGGSTIDGTSGNDTLTGTSGNDTINGLGGNDLFLAGSTGGADVIDGGTGSDSIEFKERATSGVVVDYGAGTITGGGPGTISFTGIERIVAGNFNDSMTGSAAGQTLTGQAGADTLWGAGGIDTLWGGAGADRFIFRETGSANADLVRDWASGSDKVALDNSPMSALGATGNFASGDARFKANSTGTATDTNDRVVYNTSTGSLYYDADGSGSGAAQLIATFSGNPAVAATDIVVI